MGKRIELGFVYRPLRAAPQKLAPAEKAFQKGVQKLMEPTVCPDLAKFIDDETAKQAQADLLKIREGQRRRQKTYRANLKARGK